jgi:hypothetical protein
MLCRLFSSSFCRHEPVHQAQVLHRLASHHFFAQRSSGSMAAPRERPIEVSSFTPSAVRSIRPPAVNSASRSRSTLEDICSHRAWSSRNPSGPVRSSHSTRNAQRRPSRSSTNPASRFVTRHSDTRRFVVERSSPAFLRSADARPVAAGGLVPCHQLRGACSGCPSRRRRPEILGLLLGPSQGQCAYCSQGAACAAPASVVRSVARVEPTRIVSP